MIDTFTPTYDLHHAAIFRYCLNKCRDHDIGQDLTQETFLRFWQCLERKENILNARAFLYRIASNLFIDYVRRKKESSLDQLLEVGYEPSIDTWHETVSRLDAARPLRKLESMKTPFRQVLHRRYIQGFTPAQIATMTGESSNVVSVRIFRGLKDLRALVAAPDTFPIMRRTPRRFTVLRPKC